MFATGLCFNDHVLSLKLRGKDLPVKDSWMQGGKADPYLCLVRKSGSVASLVVPKSGEYMGELDDRIYSLVHNGRKEAQQNTLDPVWPEVKLNARDLSHLGHLYNPFLINIWDYDFECPNDDFMGFCVVSIFDLIKAKFLQEGIPLQPGKAGHKWGGFLFVDEIKLCEFANCYPQPPPRSILHLVAEKGDVQACIFF